jgi:hypothetical protein
VLPPYLTLPVKTKSPTTAICLAAGLPAMSANNELVPLSYTCNILLCPDAPITKPLKSINFHISSLPNEL